MATLEHLQNLGELESRQKHAGMTNRSTDTHFYGRVLRNCR